MPKFVMLLAYVMAMLFALAAAGIVPVPIFAAVPSQDLIPLRVATGATLLLVAVIGHVLAYRSGDPRDAFDWHAGLVFVLLLVVSWLALINVLGDGLHQPTQPAEPYIVATFFMSTHYLTRAQAEIEFVSRVTMLIGLLGYAAIQYRMNARRRKAG